MGWGLGVAAVILVIAEACVRSLAWELLGATGVVKNKKKMSSHGVTFNTIPPTTNTDLNKGNLWL